MLPEFYRFRVHNGADADLVYDNTSKIEVEITPWKMASGAMEQGDLITDDSDLLTTGETLAQGASVEGAVHTNTSLLHIGFTGTFFVQAGDATEGPVTLWMEMSTDNSRWPSDATDVLSSPPTELIFLGTIDLTAAADETKMVNIQF